ncbi:MAG: 50S ribosomal protein L28 [Thermoanaerobaculia bacterium]
MAKVCDYCGKKTITGNKISHAHNLTKRRWYPNLKKVHIQTPSGKKTLLLCTRCIRSGVHLK